MGEQGSKYEKIIKKIEEIPLIEKKEESVLEFSPQEKTEQLWAFWSEYSRKKMELYRRAKKGKSITKTMKKVEETPELIKLKEQITKHWQDKRVQVLFRKELENNFREREKIKPDLGIYHQKEEDLEKIQEKHENLLRDLFVRRSEEADELTQIELAELSTQIDVSKDYLERTYQESPGLASFIQYERIKKYNQQFEKDGFIWTPSRQKLFKEILEHLVLLDKNRPMLLVGETGTGKTRLVRAAVKRLTNRPPFEIGEEAKSDIRPLLGSASIEGGETYITYGPLGQSLTGKKTSRDKESDGGGIFYMDEMNGYPPDALRSLIKQVSGRTAGEKITFAAWRGTWESIAEKSGIIGAANLPDEKKGRHLDRAPLPVEVARELTTLEVDYPEQTKENPELYEMILAVLMDKNSRIRLKEGELEPDWVEKVESKAKEKIKELDTDPKSGGTLWRFANLVAEIQKSYKGQENVLTPTKRDVSYLETAVLDPGIVLSWIREYRISQLRRGKPLKEFLQEKLKKWSEQKTYSEEDRVLLKEFFTTFDLPIEGSKTDKSDIKGEKNWSEKEIGFLSPRVPRPKEKIEEPKPVFSVAFLEDGTEIEYQPDLDKKKEELIREGEGVVCLGQTSDGKIVIENIKTKTAEIIDEENFEAIRRKHYLEVFKQKLIKLKPEDLDKKIDEIINKVASKKLDSKDQKKIKINLQKEIKDLSDQQKIDFIIELLER